MGSTKKPLQLLLVVGVLVVAIVAVYGQMRGHDAIRLDDVDYVTNNYTVQGGLTWTGVEWAFTTNTLSNWHPLTWLSHMLDCQLFGMDMGLHHLSSLALHIVDTLLLLLLLHQLSGAVWRPAFVAALFALHPLNVESVAWIAERKNVLSTMFWLLTTISYVAWVRRPKAWRYVLTLVLFALGLLAKPMLVTLPFTLLLLDYWPLGRTRFLALAAPRALRDSRPDGPLAPVQLSLGRLFLEKLSFFALALVASCVTYMLQREIAVSALGAYPLHARAGNALISYGAYLVGTVWPHDLAVLYPLQRALDARKLVAAAVMLSLITWSVVRARARQPYLLVGWLWFLGTLVPVIGIVQVGSQSMADRYAHVPLIGVFVMIAWGAAASVERWPRIKGVVVAGSVAVLLALGVKTWRQTALWRDSVTLFEHTLSVTQDNAIMHNELGIALGRLGRQDEAIAHFVETLRLMPDSADVLNNLGNAYASLGRHEEAMKCFREAIAVKPTSYETHTSLGFSLAQLGRKDEALQHYREALRLRPDYSEAHIGLASLLASQQKNREAIEHYREALRVKPDAIEARTNLGALLASQKEYGEAIEHFRAVLRIDPRRVVARNNLGHALAAQGKVDEAAAQFAESLAIDPNQPQVRKSLGLLRGSQGVGR